MGLCLFKKFLKLLCQLMENYPSSFSIKVGAHQGSALSPLLLIMVMDGSLMELLSVGDLVL